MAEDMETEDAVVAPKKEEEEATDGTAAAATGNTGNTSILLSGADEPEEEEEEDADDTTNGPAGGLASTAAAAAGGTSTASTAAAAAATVAAAASHRAALIQEHPYHLLPTIVTPSPFPHHNSSDRYRSALSRVQSNPLTDTEAWGAILTEASTSYRSLIPYLHYLGDASLATGAAPPPNSNVGTTSELEAKLDWVESCHGALLRYFPYAAAYVVSMAEILLGQTALPGEEGSLAPLPPGFPPVHDGMMTERQRRCADKLDCIFARALGVKSLDGIDENKMAAEAAAAAAALGEDGEVDPFDQTATELVGGILSPSAELWLLYVRYVTRRATRRANAEHPAAVGGEAAATARAEMIRDRTTTAYETALSRGGAHCLNNHLVWSSYLTFVKGWEDQATKKAPDGSVSTDHALLQKRLSHLRRLYQRLVGHPMTGLDQYWTEYELYEKSQGGTGADQLAAALIAEHQPRYQHARSVYLERNRICDLRNAATSLGVGRLACPPVEPPQAEGGILGGPGADGASGADVGGEGVGVGGVRSGVVGVAAGGTAGADGDEDKMVVYETKLEEELTLLSRWTTRVSYERTNPERLSGPDLTKRVRAVYKEFVQCFCRHPEAWDGWAAWELLHASPGSSDAGAGGGGGGGGGGAGKKLTGKGMRRRAAMADAVLGLGMDNIPTSALLVVQRADVLERYGGKAAAATEKEAAGGTTGGEEAIELLSKYAMEHPTTLIFVCMQKIVRKHKGINAARTVFSRARRDLRIRAEDCAEDAVASGEGTADADRSVANVVSENDEGDKAGDDTVGGNKSNSASVKGTGGVGSRRMVTTRLAPSVGVHSASNKIASAGDAEGSASAAVKRGVVTHHLFSSHADVERYLNSSPHIAARVYELGLRRHRTFLTVPSYVLGYANLLLELGDWANLRGILARSVGACEEDLSSTAAIDGADKSKTTDSTDQAAKARREASRPLWDAYLRIESLISSVSGGGDADSVHNVEARRRRALYGPTSLAGRSDDNTGEDVACGLYQSIEDNQHSNIADTLIRSDGYDASSRIANGLGRLVDSLEVCGLLGNGSSGSMGTNASGGAMGTLLSESTPSAAGKIANDDLAGGFADASFRRRLAHVQRREAMAALASITGGAVIGAAEAGLIGAGGAAGRARERLLQQQALAQATAAANAGVTIAAGSPEWLTPLIAHLPRLPAYKIGARPPPHMIEMALASLKSSDLPSERPEDPASTPAAAVGTAAAVDTAPSDPRKRRRAAVSNGGDSSDEEGAGGASGYGGQFRARQKTRMMGQ